MLIAIACCLASPVPEKPDRYPMSYLICLPWSNLAMATDVPMAAATVVVIVDGHGTGLGINVIVG